MTEIAAAYRAYNEARKKAEAIKTRLLQDSEYQAAKKEVKRLENAWVKTWTKEHR